MRAYYRATNRGWIEMRKTDSCTALSLGPLESFDSGIRSRLLVTAMERHTGSRLSGSSTHRRFETSLIL